LLLNPNFLDRLLARIAGRGSARSFTEKPVDANLVELLRFPRRPNPTSSR
jgi:hypothetical protein